MAEHGHVLRTRLTVPHLVRRKRIPLERALRMGPHEIDGASLLIRQQLRLATSLAPLPFPPSAGTGPPMGSRTLLVLQIDSTVNRLHQLHF